MAEIGAGHRSRWLLHEEATPDFAWNTQQSKARQSIIINQNLIWWIQNQSHWTCWTSSGNLRYCTPPKTNLTQPYFVNLKNQEYRSRYLINKELKKKKKKKKKTFSCFFCSGYLSLHIFVKGAFLSRTERFGTSYFVSSTGNLEPPISKSLQNGGL